MLWQQVLRFERVGAAEALRRGAPGAALLQAERLASASTTSASRSAASGRATERAAAAMAARRAGSSSSPRQRGGQGFDGQSVLAQHDRAAGVGEQGGVLALVVVERDLSGTRMAGFPATANSQTVEAPARPITRCAAASRPAMSRKKGASSNSTPASRRSPGALDRLRAGLLLDVEPLREARCGSSAIAFGVSLGQQPRALAAAGDQEVDAVGRRA